jgi:hypothetical protein
MINHVIKADRFVQGRRFTDRGVGPRKLGTTNLGEKLTMRFSSIEELDEHLNRIALVWDNGKKLQKSRSHKYIRRTGVPGDYKYFYMEGEPRGKPITTEEARDIGKKMTKEEAQMAWNEYKKRVAQPKPSMSTKEARQEFSDRAFRNQMIREMVEGFLGSEEAMTPADIDKKMDEGKTFKMQGSKDVIKGIMKEYHFKEVNIDNKFSNKYIHENTALYLHDLLDHLSGKMEIDGAGILNIRVGDIDQGTTWAQYASGKTEIDLDKKYTNTFSHEYAHFVFDRKISPELRHLYYNNFPELGYMDNVDARWDAFVEDPSEATINELYGQFFNDSKIKFAGKQGKDNEVIEKPIIELIHSITEFYKSHTYEIGEMGNSFKDEKRMDKMSYYFDPHEVLARAVGYYAEGFIMPPIKGVEDNPEWKKIVKTWGDKYLKTGIVKGFESFVIMEDEYAETC